MAELIGIKSLPGSLLDSIHNDKSNINLCVEEENEKNCYVNWTYDATGILDRRNPKVAKTLGIVDDFEISVDEPAVEVQHAYKSYTSRGKKRPILYDLSMAVKKGTIYSLLGSSGCGKTTLLTCIVGVKKLDYGRVDIFGSKAGTPESGVPGRKVGYMPQDIALYNNVSIKETLTYFGNLLGMNSSEIRSRELFLIELLSLPESSRRISTLSGGQKRRVSVAVSMIHSPPLLILDEPTVGVDPLLRESIWKHLRNLVTKEQTTVLVTTHYIDEAGFSDTVGVMRGGRLLTEKSPKDLFEEYKTTNLQTIVLDLCHNDESALAGAGRARSKSSGNILSLDPHRRPSLKSKRSNKGNKMNSKRSLEEFFHSMTRLRSLIMKNSNVIMRNFLLFVFALFIPAIHTLLMGLAIGNDPRPIKIGVVNYELNGTACDYEQVANLPPCVFMNFSCKYMDSFPKDIIQLINYDVADDAREDIRAGKIQSFMSFPPGYTDYVYDRATGGTNIDNETLEGSIVTFEMDASDAVITKSVQRIVYENYKKFARDILEDCGYNPNLAGLPIKFENPIFGKYDAELRDFVAVGAMLSISFFFPVCTCSVAYICDKKQGTMERARVAGARTWELVASYFITETIVLMIQILLSFLIFTFAFKIEILGSSLLAFLLVLINGCAGISLGLLFGSLCGEEIQSIFLAVAIIVPSLFLSGAIWPIEGMPVVLQGLTYLLPGTFGNYALRGIVTKGLTFCHPQVYGGFLSISAWSGVYWVLNLLIHRFRFSND